MSMHSQCGGIHARKPTPRARMHIPAWRPLPLSLLCDVHQWMLIGHCDFPARPTFGRLPRVAAGDSRTLFARHTPPFTHPPSALPHLESFRSIHVDPDTLREGISLSLFSEQGHLRARSPHANLDARAASDDRPCAETPNSVYPTSLAPSSPTSSPFLSYFMSTSPTGKTNASFPYRHPPGLGAPPVFEDEEGQEIGVRNFLYPRRATTGWAGNSSGHAASQTWLFRLVVPHDYFYK
ncbi:hypothetical protein BC826DRAFT_1184379 [Russula brevipes]|nr:hypothetical protein BC826DRAFT_1184379 [Russula brevipes]